MAGRSRELSIPQRVVRYWLPVLAYVALIFTLSAQAHLQPPLSFEQSDKLYHLAEYGFLGWLLARALQASLPRAAGLTLGLVALSIGIAIGTADEVFQSTVPGRECSAFDLMADTAGVALAQVAARALARG